MYRESYGSRWLVLAACRSNSLNQPLQRNLSDTHVRKLELVIGKIWHFLDPIIAVRAPATDQAVKYWTPNGNHRLSAMKTLGTKSIVAIVVPEADCRLLDSRDEYREGAQSAREIPRIHPHVQGAGTAP
jgi:ParB family chromosome partitioning protein